MKNSTHYIEEAIANLKEDRAATKVLLMSLMKYMSISEDRHKEVGVVAAKYLETLQRSIEQLVKLSALTQKGESDFKGMTDEDKKDLFDLINSEEEE